MEEEVRKDIQNALREVYSSFKKVDADSLKFASDRTLHNSSMYQDKDSISIAVVVYSLYKICSRARVKESADFNKFHKDFLDLISSAQSDLARGRDRDFRMNLKRMFKLIARLENQFGMYITQVINQSRLKKGGRVYEHGVSVGRASELLGVSPWELMNYIGSTKLADVVPVMKKENVVKRVEVARKVFNL